MDSQEGLLGGISSRWNDNRKEKIKTIALIAVTLLFAISAGLFIWQAVSNRALHKEIDNNNKIPGPYAWLSADITSKMDMSANPCDDFYQYVCGGYEAKTVLAPGENLRVGVIAAVDYGNSKLLDNIVDGQWPLLSDLMSSCMKNQTQVQAEASALFAATTAKLIAPLASSSMSDVLPVLASLHKMGVDALFVPDVMDNIFQGGSNNFLQLMMSGPSMPPIFYTDPDLKELLLNNIMGAMGMAVANVSEARARSVIAFEISLLYATPDVETYEEAFYNITLTDFNAFTGQDYALYTNSLGVLVAPSDTVIVSVPQYFQNISALIPNTPTQVIQDYLIYHLVLSTVRSYPILDESFDLADTKQLYKALRKKTNAFVDMPSVYTDPTQRQRCVDAVGDLLGDFVGLLFSTMVVDDTVKDDVSTVTKGIQTAFKNGLNDLTWINAASKQNTINKLNDIIQIIGHPNKLDRYRGVILGDNFQENIFTLKQAVFDYTMRDIGQAFNRSNYEFPPTIVNAFYSPFTNTINFPAGILESPMFSTTFPKMLQYARMGYVIGHETTHGFDNSGRAWNGQGTYVGDIMDVESGNNFNKQAQCIVDQFDNYSPVPGYTIDGEQTLGENIADLGGAKNAFRAYKAWVAANQAEFADHQIVSSLTNDQLFFTMLGQTWCTKATTAGLIYQLATDVHSPSKFRVNGPLSNLNEFASAFKCPSSSNMVNQPQCVLW